MHRELQLWRRWCRPLASAMRVRLESPRAGKVYIRPIRRFVEYMRDHGVEGRHPVVLNPSLPSTLGLSGSVSYRTGSGR